MNDGEKLFTTPNEPGELIDYLTEERYGPNGCKALTAKRMMKDGIRAGTADRWMIAVQTVLN